MFRLPSPSPQIGVQNATVLSHSVGPVVGVAPRGTEREPLTWAGVGWGGLIQPRRGKVPLVRLLEKLINVCCPSCCCESPCPGVQGGGEGHFHDGHSGRWLASWPQTPPSHAPSPQPHPPLRTVGQGGSVEQTGGECLVVQWSSPPPGQPCPVGLSRPIRGSVRISWGGAELGPTLRST